MKVSDWRHGLYQATHYKSFANRVVLALPDAKAKLVASHKHAFRLFGVGLVGLSIADGITWYVKAARRTPSSASRTVLGILEILKSREAKFLHRHGKFDGVRPVLQVGCVRQRVKSNVMTEKPTVKQFCVSYTFLHDFNPFFDAPFGS